MREQALPTYSNELAPLSDFVVTERTLVHQGVLPKMIFTEYLDLHGVSSKDWDVDYMKNTITARFKKPTDVELEQGNFTIVWEDQ